MLAQSAGLPPGLQPAPTPPTNGTGVDTGLQGALGRPRGLAPSGLEFPGQVESSAFARGMMEIFNPSDIQQAMALTEAGRDVPVELIERLATQATRPEIDQTQKQMEDNVREMLRIYIDYLTGKTRTLPPELWHGLTEERA